MHSTNVLKSIAPCVRTFALAVAAAFAAFGQEQATDCNAQSMTAEQRLARFKEVDRQAESAMHDRLFAEAVQLYQQGVCLVPNSARGFYGLGMAQAAAQELVGARESLRKADALQPTSPMPLIMQARLNLSLNDVEAVKSDLRDAASRFPNDAQSHEALARLLAEHNLFLLSLAEALRSERAAPSNPEKKVQLAVLENTVGAYDDAIRSALTVEGSHEITTSLRASAAGVAGLSYESQTQPVAAERYLKEAIELDSAQPNSYLALADFYEQSQKYAEAVAILTQARNKFGDSDSILLPLGGDLVRIEKYREGIEVLQQLLRQKPDSADAYIGLAEAAHKQGNAEEEQRALQSLERLNPNYPMIHVLIAKAMMARQPVPYNDILQELSLAEKASPTDPQIFYLRGKLLAESGRNQEAVPILRRAVELAPLDPSPYYQLAKTYQKLGQAELARQWFERVKYLDSNGAR